MTTTFTDIENGERLDISVEFVTRRRLDVDGGSIDRLRVTDPTGRTFTILTTPDRDFPVDLKTGETHHVSNLLCANPPDISGRVAQSCPDCGGDLREGQTIDAADSAVATAADKLGLNEAFGIIDDRAGISRSSGLDQAPVDDWRPMGSESTLDVPDFVCTNCGRPVSEYDLRTQQAEASYQMHEMRAESPQADLAQAETVGLATGGAKDISNFRQNIANGYTPQPEAISDEGLFYDYYFETGEPVETDALFAPRYAAAITEDPIRERTERYLSVGLDSTLAVDDFDRPRLDLVAVLDVSGSMDSAFDAYYYDEHGRRHESDGEASTKLTAAVQSLCALTEQLRPDDQLGVVLYNASAHVAKPLRDVQTTDMPAIRRHIRDISAGGSTNLADGFTTAVEMLAEPDPDAQTERRVVFMTDMMPNTGATDNEELTDLFADAATEGIHTTFIGMGLDANAELADTLSGIRGANHYFVNSATEFERRLGDEFDYMVTPLVYDLTLELDADGYNLEAVHGSPSAEAATDRLMHVGTLFPSAKADGEARGGVVLLKVEQTDTDGDLELVASWTERGGGEYTERVSVELPEEPETFEHDGVRKAIALARYARELRTWASVVHSGEVEAELRDDWRPREERGQHERESVPLVVPREFAGRFRELRAYLKDEQQAVGDEELTQEVDLLEQLSTAAKPVSPEPGE